VDWGSMNWRSLTAADLETCGAQPSPRSTARCEMPPGHEGGHGGRTRRGYWKFWATEASEDAALTAQANTQIRLLHDVVRQQILAEERTLALDAIDPGCDSTVAGHRCARGAGHAGGLHYDHDGNEWWSRP